MKLRELLFVAAFVGLGALAPAQAAPMLPAAPLVSSVAPSTVDSTDDQALREVSADSTRTLLISAMPAGVTNDDVWRQASLARLEVGDTVPRRRAVAFSDWYSRRLTVHRYGSYAMLPLFVTQFVLGNKLINQKEDLFANRRTIPVDEGLRTTHAVVAGAVGALFVVNTTTGLWNFIESRHTDAGRTRRTIHALTMLAADAGFAYTGYLGSKATDRGPPQGRQHRNVALTSFGISTAGAALMWFGQRD